MAKFSLRNSVNRVISVLKFICIYPSPKEEFPKTLIRGFVIYGLFMCPFTFNLAAKAVLSINDLAVFVNVCYITTVCVLAVMKSFYLMYHYERLVNTCKGIQENKPKMTDEQDKLITNYMQWCNNYHFMIGVVLPVLCSIFWFTTPLLNRPEVCRLPFLSWYPFDVSSGLSFWLAYFHQIISIYLIAVVNMNVDCLVGSLMAYTAGQCTILENALENIGEMTKFYFDVQDEEVREKLCGTLSKLVVYHREIRRYGRKVESLYNTYHFIQLVIIAPSLAMTMYLIFQLEDIMSLEVVEHCLYIVGILVDFFTFCWFGNEVLVQSSKLPYAAFKCNWVDAPPSFKKDLLYFIHMSQEPITMNVMFLFQFNLETYKSILRTAYSYSAVLEQVT